MDMNEILQRVDALFEENKPQEGLQLMLSTLQKAIEIQDDEAILQLLNELLGYYRETGQVEVVCNLAQKAVAQADSMGLQGTIPYATTLLNVANCYRAVGRLQDSLQNYQKVREIYDQILPQDSMLAVGLENNMSLLYQEMGDFEKAKECLLKAAAVAENNHADFETAVAYSNLATTRLQLGEAEQAKEDADKAMEAFRRSGEEDSHFAAALSALGTYYYSKAEYQDAIRYFEQAADIIERNLGKNKGYERVQENIEECRKALAEQNEQNADQNEVNAETIAKTAEPVVISNGMELCKAYYEEVGRPMLQEKFASYLDRIAVGLVGEGSDCFGYDDEQSRDHDWGPDFCIWVTKETYDEIGYELEKAYAELPAEWRGFKRTHSAQGLGRRGVMTIEAFYERFLQTADYESVDWSQVEDASLAAATNGEVFADPEGIFSDLREKLLKGYPEPVLYRKIADAAAHFAQSGEYNYARMLKRGDTVTAQIMFADAMRYAMKLQHYMEGTYPPHDKWLYRSLQGLESGYVLANMFESLRYASGIASQGKPDADLVDRTANQFEQIGTFLAAELYQLNIISDTDSYLDAHVDELLKKSAFSAKSNEELVDAIVRLEFEAFDKVQNEGGRAECQNNWPTFSIMRKSQYLTWNRTMLLQYLYDFDREYSKGHNLITEKYGRMMESTTPERYAKISENFPEIDPQKRSVIEQIVAMQVAWMEEFAKEYPHMASNARSIHTSQDEIWNTSYETYLRGEISTYSDKMLQLYGAYVVEYARADKNLTYAIMENSALLYGYENLEAAENFLEK